MKRRAFIHTTVAATALPLSAVASSEKNKMGKPEGKELYELRTYEMKFRGNQRLLRKYLTEVYEPALKRAGVNHFMLFQEIGLTDPAKLWVLISYPDANAYIAAQNLAGDEVYQKAAADYHALPPEQTIFNRYSSSLLNAFDGLPQMMDPIEGAGLFGICQLCR